MTRSVTSVLSLAALAALSACGGGAASPAGPTPAAPAPTPVPTPTAVAARYSVTFVATWRRETHPTDFPASAHRERPGRSSWSRLPARRS